MSRRRPITLLHVKLTNRYNLHRKLYLNNIAAYLILRRYYFSDMMLIYTQATLKTNFIKTKFVCVICSPGEN